MEKPAIVDALRAMSWSGVSAAILSVDRPTIALEVIAAMSCDDSTAMSSVPKAAKTDAKPSKTPKGYKPRLKADYDLLLTQRLILQPYGEVNLYGKSDSQRQVGSGLSELELSLRLRYEGRRQFARRRHSARQKACEKTAP